MKNTLLFVLTVFAVMALYHINQLENELLAQKIKYQIMQEEELSEEKLNELDIDGDGTITSLDYLLAKRGKR